MTERQIQLAIIRTITPSICCAAPNYTPNGWWECDLWAVTKAGYAVEYEIKLTAADFNADKHKRSTKLVDRDLCEDAGYRSEYPHRPDGKMWLPVNKHELALKGCGPSKFFYVFPAELAHLEPRVPAWAGVAIAGGDRYSRGIRGLREAPRLHKNKVSKREIAVCQRRMWYRYWQGLEQIQRMCDDRKRTPEIANGT